MLTFSIEFPDFYMIVLMFHYYEFQGTSKREETQQRDTRGNNIYLRAGKRAYHPPYSTSAPSNMGLGESRLVCFESDPFRPLSFKNRCVWSSGRFKNYKFLPLKEVNPGSLRWKWAPDLAIYNRDPWIE